MAIRRRRKTLTNLLSSMEGRVTSVELRPINLLTSAQIAAALAGEDETLDGGPDTVVGLDAPNQYKPVIDGYFYAKDLTGSKSRVDLYFTTDTGLSANDTIQISGIHDLIHAGGTRELEISDNYKTISVDTPPWDNRSSYNGTRNTPDSTITHTVLFNPSSGSDFGAAKQLIVKRKIASVSATTTTATVTFTSNNYFEAGDVVYVDMPSDTPFYGIDGLYRIKTVGSNFITFDFSSALDEPINSSTVTEDRYVHAVARSYTRDGATYIDTSSDPDVVYIWKDIRWVTYSTGDATKDSVAPSPIENLEATDEDETPSGAAVPRRRVTLTWSAPETNADGTPIDDLVGYTVWWKKRAAQPAWEKADSTGAQTSWSKGDFLQGIPAYFRVFARDAGGNLSTPVDITHTTGVSTPTVETPKAPTVTTYLGTIKIAYDDLTAAGLVQAPTAKEIEVFFSDVTGFTPDETNYYGKFPANAGSYIIIPGTELVDNTDYYIKIRVRDIYNNMTEASDQVAIRAKISNIVTYDMIDVGTLTGQVVIGLDMRTGPNPSVSGGIISNQQGLTAYDPDGNQTFRVDATNGVVSIGDYLGREEIAGLYVGKVDAENTYATKVTANGISITANTANTNATDALNTANTANGTANTAKSNLADITEITAGGITLRKNKVIGSINNSTTDTTEINGGVIKTGTILASEIGSGEFPVGVIYAGEISATKITSGTLSGRTIRTAASGKRVNISNADNSVAFYNSLGNFTGEIEGDTGRLRIAGDSTGSISISGTDVSFRNGSTTSLYSQGTTQIILSHNTLRLNGYTGSTSRFLFVASSGFVNAGVTYPGSLSDSRVKKEIVSLPNNLGLDFIKKINPVEFKWDVQNDKDRDKYTKKKVLGVVAQEFLEALSSSNADVSDYSIVQEDNDHDLDNVDKDDKIFRVDYVQLVPALIKAVQQLSEEVETLKKEIKNG